MPNIMSFGTAVTGLAVSANASHAARLASRRALPGPSSGGGSAAKPPDVGASPKSKRSSSGQQAFMAAFRDGGLSASELRQVFRLLDSDNSRVLTAQELRDGLTRYGLLDASDTAALSRLMGQLDKSRSNDISEDEFVAAFTKSTGGLGAMLGQDRKFGGYGKGGGGSGGAASASSGEAPTRIRVICWSLRGVAGRSYRCAEGSLRADQLKEFVAAHAESAAARQADQRVWIDVAGFSPEAVAAVAAVARVDRQTVEDACLPQGQRLWPMPPPAPQGPGGAAGIRRGSGGPGSLAGDAVGVSSSSAAGGSPADLDFGMRFYGPLPAGVAGAGGRAARASIAQLQNPNAMLRRAGPRSSIAPVIVAVDGGEDDAGAGGRGAVALTPAADAAAAAASAATDAAAAEALAGAGPAEGFMSSSKGVPGSGSGLPGSVAASRAGFTGGPPPLLHLPSTGDMLSAVEVLGSARRGSAAAMGPSAGSLAQSAAGGAGSAPVPELEMIRLMMVLHATILVHSGLVEGRGVRRRLLCCGGSGPSPHLCGVNLGCGCGGAEDDADPSEAEHRRLALRTALAVSKTAFGMRVDDDDEDEDALLHDDDEDDEYADAEAAVAPAGFDAPRARGFAQGLTADGDPAPAGTASSHLRGLSDGTVNPTFSAGSGSGDDTGRAGPAGHAGTTSPRGVAAAFMGASARRVAPAPDDGGAAAMGVRERTASNAASAVGLSSSGSASDVLAAGTVGSQSSGSAAGGGAGSSPPKLRTMTRRGSGSTVDEDEEDGAGAGSCAARAAGVLCCCCRGDDASPPPAFLASSRALRLRPPNVVNDQFCCFVVSDSLIITVRPAALLGADDDEGAGAAGGSFASLAGKGGGSAGGGGGSSSSRRHAHRRQQSALDVLFRALRRGLRASRPTGLPAHMSLYTSGVRALAVELLDMTLRFNAGVRDALSDWEARLGADIEDFFAPAHTKHIAELRRAAGNYLKDMAPVSDALKRAVELQPHASASAAAAGRPVRERTGAARRAARSSMVGGVPGAGAGAGAGALAGGLASPFPQAYPGSPLPAGSSAQVAAGAAQAVGFGVGAGAAGVATPQAPSPAAPAVPLPPGSSELDFRLAQIFLPHAHAVAEISSGLALLLEDVSRIEGTCNDLIAQRSSLQADSMNKVMLFLSITTTLGLVPTVISGYYGQNFPLMFDEADPGMGVGSFWIATAIGLVLMLLLIWRLGFFRLI